MTCVIVGAGGQLGRAFLRRLGDKAVPLDRQHLDLTQREQMTETLGRLRPSVVVNCAAYNWVDRAETERQAAFAVNAWGVADLARVCSTLGCVLVHYSTNYVFGADRERRLPYREIDLPGPLSVYGASKLAGEHLAVAHCARHFIIRTAGLFGPESPHGNFVVRMLDLARQGKTLRVVHDQVCSPTGTGDLVEATLRLIDTGRYGLYHVTSTGSCSWFEFARAILEIAGVPAPIQSISSMDFNAAASRPANGILSNATMQSLGLPPMRTWQEMLREYLASLV